VYTKLLDVANLLDSKGAARNRWDDKEVMNLLLDHYENQVTITMEVMKAVTRNDWNDQEPEADEDNNLTIWA